METLKDIAKETNQPIIKINNEDLLSLSPYIDEKDGDYKAPDDWFEKYDLSLDGFSGFPFLNPSEEEKKKLLKIFSLVYRNFLILNPTGLSINLFIFH